MPDMLPAMALTPAEKAYQVRMAEVADLLGRSRTDLTVPAWCALVMEQPELRGLHVYKITDRLRNQMSFMEEIGPGADMEHINEVMLARHGPGMYFYFPITKKEGQKLAAYKEAMGEIKDPVPASAPPPAQEAATVEQALAHAMKVEQAETFLTGREAAKVNREMAPIKAVAELMAVLKPAGDGNEKLIQFLLQQNADTQKLLLQVLQGNQARPGDPLSDTTAALDRVVNIATRMGFIQSREGPPAPSALEMVAATVKEAAPFLREPLMRIAGVMASRWGTPAQSAGRVIDGSPAAGEVSAGPEGSAQGGVMELRAEDKELVEIAINALKSKDWETLGAAYNSVRPMTMGVLPELNPNVSVALYISLLKRFDPRFDMHRAEWSLFLAWLREDLAQAEPEPGGSGGDDG